MDFSVKNYIFRLNYPASYALKALSLYRIKGYINPPGIYNPLPLFPGHVGETIPRAPAAPPLKLHSNLAKWGVNPHLSSWNGVLRGARPGPGESSPQHGREPGVEGCICLGGVTNTLMGYKLRVLRA